MAIYPHESISGTKMFEERRVRRMSAEDAGQESSAGHASPALGHREQVIHDARQRLLRDFLCMMGNHQPLVPILLKHVCSDRWTARD